MVLFTTRNEWDVKGEVNMIVYKDGEVVHKHGLEFKRVGTSAVLSLEQLDNFMYIMLESERVSCFKSGGLRHFVYDYHQTQDFTIATEFKPGFVRVPYIFKTTGVLV